jgi:small subunit ribosomal protein S18
MSEETPSAPQRPSGPPPGRSEGGPPRRDDRGGGRDDRGGGRPRRRFRGRGRRKVCRFCADKTVKIDYKWSEMLEDFVSERGRIMPSRTTGVCAKHQRRLKLAIKLARNVALLPYSRV